MKMQRMVWGLTAALMGGMVVAQDVPIEVSILGASQVTLHLYPFLKDDELATLRLVATNRDALSVFLPSKDASHFAALALAPADGFLQDGAPAPTAVALSDFPDAQTAATAVRAACDGQRDPSTDPCVVVLEVGPAP